MPYFGVGAVCSHDGDDVEPYVGMYLVGFHKSVGGNGNGFDFLWCNGHVGIHEAFVASRFHLHDDQQVFFLFESHDVQVAMAVLPVAKENLAAFPLKVLGGQLFAPVPQIVVCSHVDVLYHILFIAQIYGKSLEMTNNLGTKVFVKSLSKMFVSLIGKRIMFIKTEKTQGDFLNKCEVLVSSFLCNFAK